MPTLTVKNGDKEIKLAFSGTPVLRDVLAENGFAVISPCGGKGVCGKCAVIVCGDITPPDERESDLNLRLSCRTRLLGDAFVELKRSEYIFDKDEKGGCIEKKSGWVGLGVAIDIGTTTVILKLFDDNGNLLGEGSSLNPQSSIASDVIGRIDAALRGRAWELHESIVNCIDGLAKRVCADASRSTDEIKRAVITGNTAMMYLLTCRNPESISKYPFESETLFGEWVNENTYLAPCMNAYVGGDITCAVLASGMNKSDKTVLLCDIGTNGEIALWKEKTLFTTSAAAGPAFEGAEISCGCQNILGAVNRVWVENGRIVAETVGGASAVGINGSGLLDAVSAFLDIAYIDKTGYAEKPLEIFANGGKIALTQDDIRAFQLAKAAIRAGIETLLESTDTKLDEVDELLISGSFGSNLSISSAVKTGLIPKELGHKARCIGNAALDGAVLLLSDDSLIQNAKELARDSKHIQLGGSEEFYYRFINAIDFE